MGVRDSGPLPDAEAASLAWCTSGSAECPVPPLLALARSLPTLLKGIGCAPGLSCLWVC